MGEMWCYDKVRRFDANGKRWHFVRVYHYIKGAGSNPYEVYFRDDARTEFGLLRFEDSRDNPYRDFVAIAKKDHE
jgi:hypothetical protein